jgi:hypothetical protein
LTGAVALSVIEPATPFDAGGRLSVKVPLCPPGDAVAAGPDGVPGVGTEVDGAHAETMPLSTTKAIRAYIRLQVTVALLARAKRKGIATK